MNKTQFKKRLPTSKRVMLQYSAKRMGWLLRQQMYTDAEILMDSIESFLEKNLDKDTMDYIYRVHGAMNEPSAISDVSHFFDDDMEPWYKHEWLTYIDEEMERGFEDQIDAMCKKYTKKIPERECMWYVWPSCSGDETGLFDPVQLDRFDAQLVEDYLESYATWMKVGSLKFINKDKKIAKHADPLATLLMEQTFALGDKIAEREIWTDRWQWPTKIEGMLLEPNDEYFEENGYE